MIVVIHGIFSFKFLIENSEESNLNFHYCPHIYFSSKFLHFLDCYIIFLFLRLQRTVYQDMSLPLSAYYMASSHNTYLEGDQLTSASSANRQGIFRIPYEFFFHNQSDCLVLSCLVVNHIIYIVMVMEGIVHRIFSVSYECSITASSYPVLLY